MRLRFVRIAFVLALLSSSGPAPAQTLMVFRHWQPAVNSMTDDRWAPSFAPLPGGMTALIAGGYSFGAGRCVATADRYDLTKNRFFPCKGRLTYPRDFALAVPLPDGTILICGGYNDILASLDTSEIYNPGTDTFTLLPSKMTSPRELHQATVLSDGKILVTGGLNLYRHKTTASAEVFDPKTRNFTPTNGPMAMDRFGHAACRLSDGKVLIVGGTSVYFSRRNGYAHVLASAEIYDPATDRFSGTLGDMTIARDRPTATLLSNGTVLIEGGQGANGASVMNSEIFDPGTGKFTLVASPQQEARMAHDAALLPNGDVFITGGWSAPHNATTATTEIYSFVTGTFESLAPLPFSSHDAAQIVFPNGDVLVAGGKSVAIDGTVKGISAGAVLRIDPSPPPATGGAKN